MFFVQHRPSALGLSSGASSVILPPTSAVAAGVRYGYGGSMVGTLAYAGFVPPDTSPPPTTRRRSTPALILTKHVADVRLYDIDCSDLLDDSEQILYVKSISSDQGSLGFGAAQINPAPVYYARIGNWADTAKVVQVQIQGGFMGYGECELYCRCRMVVVTNENPAIEVPFTIRLVDGGDNTSLSNT